MTAWVEESCQPVLPGKSNGVAGSTRPLAHRSRRSLSIVEPPNYGQHHPHHWRLGHIHMRVDPSVEGSDQGCLGKNSAFVHHGRLKSEIDPGVSLVTSTPSVLDSVEHHYPSCRRSTTHKLRSSVTPSLERVSHCVRSPLVRHYNGSIITNPMENDEPCRIGKAVPILNTDHDHHIQRFSLLSLSVSTSVKQIFRKRNTLRQHKVHQYSTRYAHYSGLRLPNTVVRLKHSHCLTTGERTSRPCSSPR
jgi:hypothetical protein